MNTEQLKALYEEIHKAVMVDGWAKAWRSAAHRINGDLTAVYVDISQVDADHIEELKEILLKHGLFASHWNGLTIHICGQWESERMFTHQSIQGRDIEVLTEDGEAEDGTKLMIEGSLGMDGCEVKVVRRENG